tara:strand:+ start:261 stop:794 length:534 start_codon:yes stop_codon:yes gene_type:complete
MKKISGLLVIMLLSLLLFSSCKTIPKEALQLSPESLQQRQLQTRRFDTSDENALLLASSALLQDMGFNIDESETRLGVIVGSKQRDAKNAGQIVGAVFVALLSGAVMATDKAQTMRASLVTRPLENGKKIAVRVTFQRVVVNTQNQISKQEGINDPKIYQEFFEKLSKSVFLEAHEI